MAIAHCNFGLRSADSEADEALVRDWAAQQDIAFHSVKWDTKSEAARMGKGTQETARVLRYEWLEETRKKFGYSYIATAHHEGDVAETVLINLMRGCGISGLHGIPEKNEKVIRPLLFADKKDLKEYATAMNLSWREDASNISNDYTRNAIRNLILPEMKKLFPAAQMNIAATANRVNDAEKLYKEAVENKIKKLVQQRGRDFYIPILQLKNTTAPSTVLWEFLKNYGFNSLQTEEALQLCEAPRNKYLSSGSHRLIKEKDFLILTASASVDADKIWIEQSDQNIAFAGGSIQLSESNPPFRVTENEATAQLDADKLSWPLVLRKRKEGDYFYPLGMTKKKKLGRFLTDLKLAAHVKESLWVLESNHRIVWIVGLRIDNRFRLTATTKMATTISLQKQKNQ